MLCWNQIIFDYSWCKSLLSYSHYL